MKFRLMGFVWSMCQSLNTSGMFCMNQVRTNEADFRKKMASGRMVGGNIRSLVNGRGLQLQCARALHESLLVPALMYVVRQCYGKKMKGLGLGPHRLTTSKVC